MKHGKCGRILSPTTGILHLFFIISLKNISKLKLSNFFKKSCDAPKTLIKSHFANHIILILVSFFLRRAQG